MSVDFLTTWIERASATRKSSRRNLLLLGQACLSVGLLAFLLSRVDIGRAWSSMSGAHHFWLFLAALQLSVQLILAALRWKVVAEGLGGQLPLAPALRFVWIGTFLSQVLPGSTMGGDAARMWLYWRHSGDHRLAIHSVVLERVFMVGALVLVVLMVQPGLAARGAPMAIVAAAVITLVLVIGMLIAPAVSTRLLASRQHWALYKVMAAVSEDVRRIFTNLPRGTVLTGVSVVAHLNMSIAAWLIGRALGLNISVLDCIVLMPVIILFTTIPISVGGWGIREGAAIALFGLVGVESSEALALSIIVGLGSILVSIPGAMLWIPAKPRPAAGENRGE